MKRYDKWLLPLLLILLLAGSVYAGQGAAVQPKFRINIKTEGAKPGEATDPRRIRVQYFKPYHPLSLPLFSPGKADEYVWTDKNGQVDFTLPAFDEPIYMILASGGDIGSFLVEKDDDVVINVLKRVPSQGDPVTTSSSRAEGSSTSISTRKGDLVSVTGRGAEKYLLALKLEKLCSFDFLSGEYPDAMMKVFYPNWPKGGGQDTTTDMLGKMDKYCQVTASFLQQKAKMIESSGISPKMKKLSAYQFANIADFWLTRMYYTFYNIPEWRLAGKALIDKYRKQFMYAVDPLMALAPHGLMHLADSEYKLLVMNTGGKTVEYKDLYNLFKSKYSGPVREMLLGNLLMQGTGWRGTGVSSVSLLDSLMQDGLQYLSIPLIKNTYTTKLKLSPGKAIFNGKFKDQNGKEVSLASLKGKVILLDFWFTGCSGCMIFHQKFHAEGYPLVKDNKDFMYVSVGIDKQKEMWLKSIATNNYTSAEYLNLHAEKGVDDPFLKYYERATFPFVVFVDKNGHIYYGGINNTVEGAVKYIREASRTPYQGS